VPVMAGKTDAPSPAKGAGDYGDMFK
jgi:hypothetical protein